MASLSPALPRIDRIRASRHLCRLALPICGAQLAQIGVSTSGIMMAGRSSTVDLAAVSIGASLWVPLMLFMSGTMIGLTAVVAQLLGAGQVERIREQVHQAGWIALAMGLIAACALSWLPSAVFALMDIPAEIATAAEAYLLAVAFGMPALAGYQALRAYSDGFNHTRPALWFSLLGLAVHLPLGLWLIFGGAGVPPLGALGCGIATAVSMWASLFGMLAYTKRARIYQRVALWRGLTAPQPAQLLALLRLGLPIGVAIFAEVTMFAVVALLIATYGTVVIAAHEVALNFTSILFMMPLAVGMALTIQVGTRLGEGRPGAASQEAWNGLWIALAAALANALVVVLFARQVAALYSTEPAVIELAVELLYLAVLFQVSDALQIGIAGALRGYKDTRAVMLITLFAYWVAGLGSGLAFGRGVPGVFDGHGVHGFWIGLIVGLSTAAALLALRLSWVSRRRLDGPTPHRPTPAPPPST